MDDREWTEAARTVIPLFSLAVAMMGLSLGNTQGTRVRYQDGGYLTAVRGIGEWCDIRDFVQPDAPDIRQVYHHLGASVDKCFDFVCRNISYRRDIGEYWQFPSETISRGLGDCEDSSNLLCSLLRNFTDAYVVLGGYRGFGHAWVKAGHGILESTYARARPVADAHNYESLCYFNDVQVVEVCPGALQQVFQLRRNEATKLNLMADTLTLV